MIHKFKVKRHGRALLAEAGKNLPSWATPGNAEGKKDWTIDCFGRRSVQWGASPVRFQVLAGSTPKSVRTDKTSRPSGTQLVVQVLVERQAKDRMRVPSLRLMLYKPI